MLTTFKPGNPRLVSACFILLLIALSLLSSACNNADNGNHPIPDYSPEEAHPGGDTTVSITPFASFERPAANLPRKKLPDFHAGKALANQPWIKAPTATDARDGLGPIYNARTCLACHINGGKGRIPDSAPGNDTPPLFSAFVRISVPGNPEKTLGVQSEPTYGDQLQTQSVSLAHQLRKTIQPKQDVAPEAYVYVNWVEHSFEYPDQTRNLLRKPKIDVRNLYYGPLHPKTQFSLRLAPTIHGMGLIEMIPEKDLLALTDPEDQNRDGISGRANRVWDAVQQKTTLGRFGHKANRPNLDMVVAGAFANDIGISNPLFPDQPCTTQQTQCTTQANGNDVDGFELPEHLLKLVVEFNRNLGVPVRRTPNQKNIISGRSHFYRAGCADCHQPRFVTGVSEEHPHLSEQTIWPYSDFLLHDMGPDLADHRPDFEANGQEWRTAPLWGAGLNKAVNGSELFLHDGRARSIEEAILWHGGEAEITKQHFINMPLADRLQLIEFVESL